MSNNMFSKKVGFIGAGNMAQAIGLRLIDAGLPATNITVSATSRRNLGPWTSAGVNVTLNNNEVVAASDIVFLAMKPQFLSAAIESLQVAPSSKIYVSILAGVSLHTLEKYLIEITASGGSRFPIVVRGILMAPHGTLSSVAGTDGHHKIVKVMPNTPILVGAGCSVLCANAVTPAEEVKLVQDLMSVGGLAEVIPEEQFNSISALSGSGPAFIFLAIEALSDGAVLRGVPRALATKLAAKMVEGAGKLVAESGKHPGQLKDEVCSPGGTTIVGVKKLEESGIRNAFMSAVVASAEKADSLSALFKK